MCFLNVPHMCLLNVPPDLTQMCFFNVPQMCLLKKMRRDLKYMLGEKINMEDQLKVLNYCSWFTFTQFLLNLRTFVAKSALSRLRALGGTFWPKFGGRRHQNILLDRARHLPHNNAKYRIHFRSNMCSPSICWHLKRKYRCSKPYKVFLSISCQF